MRPLSLLTALLFATLSLAAKRPKEAILLSTVKSLTLHANSLTTSRRLAPVPQLTCVGGSASKFADVVEVMRCTNSGRGYGKEDVEWTCQAELPEEFKLGSTQVVCEGYEGPEDEYVLRGSCGVEFRLVLTGKGEERYGREPSGLFGKGSGGEGRGKGLGETLFQLVFWGLFIGIIGLIVYSVYTNNGNAGGNAGRRRPGGGWGGGGWGGGDDNDPPPPYEPRSQPPSKQSWSSQPSSSNAQGWRPGFWSGAAAGAAGASYLGNRNRTAPAQAGPSNWFGNGGGRAAPSYRGGGGGSSSSPPSSSRYESTGFGGTSRR
ncbi:hypothetical protein LTR95_010599 [Oleoguttula sp. CCFEE 5521]